VLKQLHKSSGLYFLLEHIITVIVFGSRKRSVGVKFSQHLPILYFAVLLLRRFLFTVYKSFRYCCATNLTHKQRRIKFNFVSAFSDTVICQHDVSVFCLTVSHVTQSLTHTLQAGNKVKRGWREACFGGTITEKVL
jgi:hypothetical protein